MGFNQENPASLFYENAMTGIQLFDERYLRKIEKFGAEALHGDSTTVTRVIRYGTQRRFHSSR